MSQLINRNKNKGFLLAIPFKRNQYRSKLTETDEIT